MAASILIIEDELPMRRVLRNALGSQGYLVWEAGTAGEGRSAFASHSPQVVLLDLGLPDGDGFELVTEIRQRSETPIVIISARGEERDQVRALDGGANDYVTKPFREAELLARLRAVLRSAARAGSFGESIKIGPLQVFPLEHKVHLSGVEVTLTPTEYNLVQTLAREAGRVVTHRRLLKEVWGADYVDDVQYLRVFMKQIRQKLEQDPTKPRLFVTAPGVGYRLKSPD